MRSANANCANKKKPSEYLRDMYHDSIVFTPDALQYLIANVGADRVYLGTDYPFKWAPEAVDLILDTFVRTVGVNEGARAVDGRAQPLGVTVPLGPL